MIIKDADGDQKIAISEGMPLVAPEERVTPEEAKELAERQRLLREKAKPKN